MLAMGRALMGAPKLLMLDEPSLGLAPIIVADIFRTITELRANGVSVLLVEQNAQAALQIAGRAYVMELGEFVLPGGKGHRRKCRRCRKLPRLLKHDPETCEAVFPERSCFIREPKRDDDFNQISSRLSAV